MDPWVEKIPWKRSWQHTPVFLPGKSHEQKRLIGYNPWGHKELDMIEHPEEGEGLQDAAAESPGDLPPTLCKPLKNL